MLSKTLRLQQQNSSRVYPNSDLIASTGEKREEIRSLRRRRLFVRCVVLILDWLLCCCLLCRVCAVRGVTPKMSNVNQAMSTNIFFYSEYHTVHDIYVGIRTARLVFWVISLLDHWITVRFWIL